MYSEVPVNDAMTDNLYVAAAAADNAAELMKCRLSYRFLRVSLSSGEKSYLSSNEFFWQIVCPISYKHSKINS